MRCTPLVLAGIFAASLYAHAAPAQASLADQTTPASRAALALQRSGMAACPGGFPLACPGTDHCCPAGKSGDKIAQWRCPKGQHWDGRRQTCEPNQ